MVAGLLIRLFVEAHHEMFEQVPHLQVINAVGVQVYVCHRLDDGEQAVAGVELFDLVGELEALEDVARGGREAVDVGDEVRRDVLGIAEQPLERERAGVVQRVLALRVGRAPQ